MVERGRWRGYRVVDASLEDGRLETGGLEAVAGEAELARSECAGRVELRSERVGRVELRSERASRVELRSERAGRVELRSERAGRIEFGSERASRVELELRCLHIKLRQRSLARVTRSSSVAAPRKRNSIIPGVANSRQSLLVPTESVGEIEFLNRRSQIAWVGLNLKGLVTLIRLRDLIELV